MTEVLFLKGFLPAILTIMMRTGTRIRAFRPGPCCQKRKSKINTPAGRESKRRRFGFIGLVFLKYFENQSKK
jgi:hypothetical protein